MEQQLLIHDKAEYAVALIAEFALRFGLTEAQAYRYLKTYDAISLIDKHYGMLHTMDFRGNVDDLAAYCRSRGGQL